MDKSSAAKIEPSILARLSKAQENLDYKDLIKLKMPSNHIARSVFAFSVLTSPLDKKYKAIPKVQNMWDQRDKKNFEQTTNDFFENRKEQLVERKVQIAKGVIHGLSEGIYQDSSSTVLEAVKAIIEYYEALHGEVKVEESEKGVEEKVSPAKEEQKVPEVKETKVETKPTPKKE